MRTKFPMIIAAATLAVLTPIAASAQDSATTTTTGYADEGEEEFPWGLLGLLGLGGLLGLRRREDRVHPEARRT